MNHKSAFKELTPFVTFCLFMIPYLLVKNTPPLFLLKLFVLLIGLAVWFCRLGPWVKSRTSELEEQAGRRIYLEASSQYLLTWFVLFDELAPYLITNMVTGQYPDSEIPYFLLGFILVGMWLGSLNGLKAYQVLSIQIEPPLLYWTRFFPVTVVTAAVAWFSREMLDSGRGCAIVYSIFIAEFTLVWVIVFLRHSRGGDISTAP